MSRRVAVVPHTHWDREWYAQVESYRARLVAVVDQVLDLVEAEPTYGPFLLDGQTALIDDYLDARPDQTARLARLVAVGRIEVGPWHVLMDEFCVSGETIWRNLQLGLVKATSFGGRPAVGYLPDMFGHIRQMPQLLAQAGLEHAVVWRGVPDVLDRSAFWWESPDGSRVRAEYLPVGYASGAFLPRQPEDLIRRVAAHEREISPVLADSWPMLLLNGGDHHPPQAWVPGLLAAANQAQDAYRFESTGLSAFLRGAPIEALPVWAGELRSGSRADLLLGVASNRVDIKQAAAQAERGLEKEAEPLCTVWLPPELWPHRDLDDAWRALILNSAHDSICACSADPVVRAVRARYDSAVALARAATKEAVAIAEVATEWAGPLVLNPTAHSRGDVVELVVAGTEPPAGTQLLDAVPAAEEARLGVGRDLGRILGELARDGFLGPDGLASDARLAAEAEAEGLEVILQVDPASPSRPEMAAVMAEAWARAGAGRDRPLRVVVHRAASARVAARVSDVPGFGWRGWAPGPLDVAPVVAGPLDLDNGFCRIEIDSGSGTFSLNGVHGLGALIDEGDQGDTYTFSPAGQPVSAPVRVTTAVIEPGPVRGVVRIRRWFEWPAELEADQRVGQHLVEVTTDIELRAGDGLVRVTVAFDNPCRDHRVRALFPLPETASESVAECAFGTVTRPAEGYGGGPHEVPVPCFPSRRFVQAGGLTLVHDGLLEYEVLDAGQVLALTLLRSVGVLSRPAPPYRPNAAGPALPVPGAQLLGPHRCRFALAVGQVDPWPYAETAWTPLIVARGSGTGRLPARGSRLSISGDVQVSALRRVGGQLELRVFNPTDRAAPVSLPDHSGSLVDLRGEPIGRWDGTFEVAPWAIVTARLDRVSLD